MRAAKAIVDMDGNIVRFGDRIVSTDGEALTVVKFGRYWREHEGLECVDDAGAAQQAINVSKFWRLVPPAPEQEESVRGWKKSGTDWPQPVPFDDVEYVIDRNGWVYRCHIESNMALKARGRPLTLREVVDIIDPIKDAPDPAGSVGAATREDAEREPSGSGTSTPTQPAAVGAVPCGECGAVAMCAFVSCLDGTPLQDEPLCIYCETRWKHVAAETEPDVILLGPVEDIEGDVFERCNAEWP